MAAELNHGLVVHPTTCAETSTRFPHIPTFNLHASVATQRALGEHKATRFGWTLVGGAPTSQSPGKRKSQPGQLLACWALSYVFYPTRR